MRLRVSHQQLQFGPILARFVDYYSLIWGPKAISMVVDPMLCLLVGRQDSQFGPVLACFLDDYSLFWGPGVISMVDEPRMHLRVRRQHSQFRLILVRFMHYYSPFGGPREIFMIDDPHGAFACRSSTLAILADPGPFHGLLLTVWGPERFLQLMNPGVRLRVGHQQS